MTEQTQPTDADLKERCAEIVEWQRTGVLHGSALRNYAGKHWAGHTDALQMAERDTSARAMELIAKWGTPAGAGEVVDRSVAVNLARNAIERYDCKGITTKGIHTLCTALLAMDAQLSAGRPDGTRDQKTWCSYVAGMIATYLRKDADGAEATAIAGIIERRLMFLLPTTPQPTQAQAGAVPLTDEQIDGITSDNNLDSIHAVVRYVERLHGIKGADHV